jgi:uncharacterized protein (TIGR03067 family)
MKVFVLGSFAKPITDEQRKRFRTACRCFFGVLLVLTTPLTLSASDDDVHKELNALQGKWKTVALEAGGMPLPKESLPDFLFIVGADGKSTGQMGKDEYHAKVSVDPAKNPKTINNVHETGPHKGEMQFGIYKVEGGKWIVCMTAPGAAEGDRPKTFDTKNTENVLFIFERVQEGKKP